MTVLKIDESEGTHFGKSAEEVLHTIDFSGWSLYPEQNEQLMKALEAFAHSAMAEAIRNTWQWDQPEITFESDGANIFVSMNIGSSWNDGRIWLTASISEMIDDYLWCTNPSMMGMDDSNESRTELAETLRDCASKLEAAVGKEVDRKTDPSETAWATELAQGLEKEIEEKMRQAFEETDNERPK